MNTSSFFNIVGARHGGKIKTACGALTVVDLNESDLKQLVAIIQEGLSQAERAEERALKSTKRFNPFERRAYDQTDC